MLLTKNSNYLKRSAGFIFIYILLLSCHKEKESFPIEGVTGFTWKAYTVQDINDNSLNPIPTDWELTLNNDRSFSFSLSNSICHGTYKWTTIDMLTANIEFTIKDWSNPSQSSAIADKLKNIVQVVDKCYSYKPPFPGQYPGPPANATMVLQFQGNQGFFYVYR